MSDTFSEKMLRNGFLTILLTVCFLLTGFSQELQFTRAFTMADGLPSNHIYSCTQDDKGFLWVGTDNGVARFDGKYFQVFSGKDGVPDNDILEVVKEKDGTIWINSYKQGPSYFDEKLNRFVDPLQNEKIDKEFIKLVLWVKALPDGGIVFYNSVGECYFKNRKLIRPSSLTAYKYREGISIITYSLSGNKLSHTIQNISQADGLPANIVNDIHQWRDTAYAATENGLAIIPVNLNIPVYDIKTFLTEIKVNQEAIPISNNFKLKNSQRTVALTFAGISLGGYFKNIQYMLNDRSGWLDLSGNILNIELESGEHTIYIRSVDVNGHASKQLLALNFHFTVLFGLSF